MLGQELIHGQNHTHLPLLIMAVKRSKGPVLEIGTGDASTPNLHELVHGTGRQLFSYDDNPDWIERYASLRRDWHTIELVQYDKLDLENGPADGSGPYSAKYAPEASGLRWGAVLIDHAPMDARIREILRLKDIAEMIVIHDTDAAEGHAFDAVWPQFRFRTTDRRFKPWTDCVSNARDFRGAPGMKI